MYGDQYVEFVCGYWDFNPNKNLKNLKMGSTQENVVIPMSGEIKVTSVKRTSSAHVVTY